MNYNLLTTTLLMVMLSTQALTAPSEPPAPAPGSQIGLMKNIWTHLVGYLAQFLPSITKSRTKIGEQSLFTRFTQFWQEKDLVTLELETIKETVSEMLAGTTGSADFVTELFEKWIGNYSTA